MVVDGVVLYAEFTARPGLAEAVRVLLREYARVVRREAGNLGFDLFCRAESENQFFIFEVYRSEADFNAHLASEYGAEFNARLSELIVGSGSELRFLRNISDIEPSPLEDSDAAHE